MKVKKYTGETIQDVIFQVKADLGPEAVIINKRKFKKGGIFGFFGSTMFEVVAALEDKKNSFQTKNSIKNLEDNDRIEISNDGRNSSRNIEADKINKTASSDPENKNAIKEFISGLQTQKEVKSREVKDLAVDYQQQDKTKNNSNQFKDEFEKVENEVKNRAENKVGNTVGKKEKFSAKNESKTINKEESNNSSKNLSAEQRLQNKFKDKVQGSKQSTLNNDNQLYNYLLAQGVESRNLNIFLKKLNDEINFNSEKEYKDIIKSFFEIYYADNGEIDLSSGRKIITFIGPTGVGKTTTMAKIAAYFAVEKNKNVGLITADTYRIAAVEQLKTYSDIIDIPFAVCYSGSKLEDMIEGQFRNCDLILIDTPGSSWKDKEQLGRLRDFTDQEFIDEVHLLLGLNTKSSDLRNIFDKFSQLNPDKILLTKLDETSSYGDLINLRENYKIPLSYLTCGQDVPEDLETASAEKIYQYLFGDFYA